MIYIVWTDNRTEGWSRSPDLATLAQCLDYIRTETYGRDYFITKPVWHELVEINHDDPR